MRTESLPSFSQPSALGIFLNNFQRLNPELPAGNELTFFALARWALCLPGRFIQGKDEGAPVALQPGGDAGDTQPRSRGDRFLAHEVKVSLDPFIVEVADFADLQVDLYDLGSLISNCIIEGNIQDGLGYGKLMHEIFCTEGSFPELLPARMAEELLNQGKGLKSMEKRERRHLPKRGNPKAGTNRQKVL
jgi:hypothetical protein